MKNKTITIIVLIILVVVLAVSISVYFIKRTPAVNQKGTKSGAEAGNQANAGQPQNKLITDDFSVNLPAGWKQTAPAIGASAMAVYADENIADPQVQKINFKSYFAVSYDTLQGKSMNDYLQIVKNGLLQTIPNVIFTKEQDIMIGGRPARAMEAELTQQGVNFKILMVVIAGQGEDVWVLSFNTTKGSWDGYKEMFYNIAGSFSLKK
ncbi:MAG: DUF1795 domain-containing protein [Patescibacteria group bacterium]|nr:DUF1795 domain-containing protein [Patescibacteria group bacterium]